jgi:type I restriction enzyme S subunit
METIKRDVGMSWQMVKLSSVAEVIAGQSPESKYYNDKGEGIPFFQGKADFRIDYPIVRYWCTQPTKIAKPTDILMSVRAPVGPTNICDVEACIGRGLAAIRTSDRLYFKYLYFFFKTIEEKLASQGNGSTFSAITTGVIKDLQIPLPPLPIQKRIAEILDAADALKRKDQQLLQKYDELAQAIFIDMFGDPVKNEKGVTLNSLIKVNPTKSEIMVNDNVEVTFVPMSNVGEDGDFNNIETRKYAEVKSGFTYFREDDVLFAKITPCMENGKGAIAKGLRNGVGFGSTEFHVLRPNEILNSQFLFHLTKISNFRVFAEMNMTGSAGQKRVPTDFFRKIRIDTSKLEKQSAFAKAIDNLALQKKTLIKEMVDSDNLFQTLIQKAFKGELVSE